MQMLRHFPPIAYPAQSTGKISPQESMDNYRSSSSGPPTQLSVEFLAVQDESKDPYCSGDRSRDEHPRPRTEVVKRQIGSASCTRGCLHYHSSIPVYSF